MKICVSELFMPMIVILFDCVNFKSVSFFYYLLNQGKEKKKGRKVCNERWDFCVYFFDQQMCRIMNDDDL